MIEIFKALCLITGAAFWGVILLIIIVAVFFMILAVIEELIESLKVKKLRKL